MLAFLLSSQGAFAQNTKLSVTEKSVSLKNLIEKVEKMSGYNFFYNAQFVDVNQKVSINKKDVGLEELLAEIFKGTGIRYKIVDKQVVLSPANMVAGDVVKNGNGSQQPENKKETAQRVAKGVVYDENGVSIPGASVTVKSTSVGVATNSKGEFSIILPPGRVIISISCVGYQAQDVQYFGKDIIVNLKPDLKKIDEVVVTGYQTISKERATGAFARVTGETMERQSLKNILTKLEGQTSGVLFDASGNVTIRGISTLRGEKTPLIVVDGFPIEGSLENVNPNDVESITVLKDAAAASIWGARAANGVIVIVSKRNGEKGATKVEFSSSVSISSRPDLFDLKVAPTSSFLELEKFLADNNWQSLPTATNAYPVTDGMDTYLSLKTGQLTQEQADAKIAGLRGVDVRKEFSDLFLRRAVRSQYNLAVSGSGEKNSYYMSLNYDNDKSTSKRNDNSRLLSSLRMTSIISNRIKVNAGLTAGIRKNIENGISLKDIGQIPQYQTIVDKDGRYVPQPRSYYQKTKDDLVAKGYPYNWDYNLKQEYDNSNKKTINTDLKMNAGVNLALFEGVSLDGGVQYEWGDIKSDNLYNENTYTVRSQVNDFTYISNGKVISNLPKGAIFIQKYGNYSAFTTRAQLNINRTLWSDKHALNAIAGIELRKVQDESSNLKKYGYDPQSLQYVAVNSTVLYPTAMGRSRSIGDATAFADNENRFVSYYTNAGYTYSDRYTLTASARLDDSNLFGADTKYRNVPLWSAGVNWQIHKEKFFKVAAINRLNLRLTYGTNGNVDKTTSPYLIAGVGKDFDDQHLFAYVQNPQNPTLRWEKTAVTNVGVDYILFNDRVSGSLEYYYKYSTDLLGDVSLNSTYGFSSALMNTAEMKNKGIDCNVNVLVVNKAIKWNTGINFSYNKNEVVKVEMPSLTVGGYRYGSPMVGKPIGYMYSYQWAGLSADGFPQIYNEKNEILSYQQSLTDPKGLHYDGNTIPKYYGSWQNEISYKGLMLSMLVTYKFGYKFRRSTISYRSLIASVDRNFVHEDFDKRWRQPGDEKFTDVPKIPQNSNELSSYFEQYAFGSTNTVEDGSHIRFKEVILSYDLPKHIIRPAYLRSLNVGFQVRNLGVILFNKSGIDPEVSPILLGSGLPMKPEYTFSIKAIF